MNLKVRHVTSNPNGTKSLLIIDKGRNLILRQVITDYQFTLLKLRHTPIDRKLRNRIIKRHLKYGYEFGGRMS